MKSVRPLTLSSLTCVICALCAATSVLHAQENIDDFTWPQQFESAAYEIAIYEPQIHEWQDMKHVVARAAVGMTIKGTDRTTFGAITIEADTAADFAERVVHFGDREFTKFHFPEAESEDEAKTLEQVVRSILKPTRPLNMSLDSMTANVDRTALETREVNANLAPPPIFYSDGPALLVMFLGDPKFQLVDGADGLLFAVNTNWDILLDTETSIYYLLGGDFWLKTDDVMKGTWSAVETLPATFSSLPDDDNWKEVRANLTAPPAKEIPKLFVVNRPAELILTKGKPELTPVSGTKLLTVTNTDADIFYLSTDKKYYFLTTGRWFKASGLEGPWEAATKNLPEEFAKLPDDDEHADILASVPGTAAAEEAVITASIPKLATVNRAEAKLDVTYDGDPKFIDVPGTSIQFAVNSPNDVFLVSPKYYCCYQGVWFEAPAATGEWIVCDDVPEEIYTIPADHPKYNVSYVQVYDSTPTTVQVGSTSGYEGAYVAGGLLMFGLGYWLGESNDWWDDSYWGYYNRYPPAMAYYGYGCGARYNWYNSGFYNSGYRYYGPYGGAGAVAGYNPTTGTYARGGYRYGPYGGVAAGSVYNPYTGAYAKGAYKTAGYSSAGARAGYNPYTNTYARQAGVSTPYGSWGRSTVVRNDEAMRTAHVSNWKGTAAGVQTSRGGGAIAVDRNYGSDGFVGKTGAGDVYVGKDGNVYKRDADGGWQSRSDGSWNDVQRPEGGARNWTPGESSPTAAADRLKTGSGDRSSAIDRVSSSDLKRPSTTSTQAISQRASQLQASRPSTQATRPSVQAQRPSTTSRSSLSSRSSSYSRPSYTPSYSSSRQLGWDSRSRSRSSYQSSRASSYSRGSSGISRGTSGRSFGGGGMSRGGGGRRR